MTQDLVLGRKATDEEQKAIETATAILAKAGLVLIGTRPNDR